MNILLLIISSAPYYTFANNPVSSPDGPNRNLTTTEGKCGAGYSCYNNECCSVYGYCGIGPEFCGAGCKSAFGRCDSTPVPSYIRYPISDDGSCGNTSKGYKSCPQSTCCSNYGFCGSSMEYCGSGCQNEFGFCPEQLLAAPNSTVISVPTPTKAPQYLTPPANNASLPVSSGGFCGKTQNGTSMCAPGSCCSEYGFCGNSSMFCGPGCQASYGECSSSAITPSKNSSQIAAPTSPHPISPDEACGVTKNGTYSCSVGSCCSQYGFCGTTALHCSSGCQKDFGQCGSAAPPTASPNGPTAGIILDQCVSPGKFALTFDDGPNVGTTTDLLKILDRLNVKATFFMICQYLEDPNLSGIAKQVLDAGHQIGQHEYSHASLDTLSIQALDSRMKTCNSLFSNAIGKVPKYFRAPYGVWPADAVKYLGDNGYILNNWNGDSNDWQLRDSAKDLKSVQDQMQSFSASKKSWVFLFHDIYDETVKSVVNVVQYVRSLNYTIVNAKECYQDQGTGYF